MTHPRLRKWILTLLVVLMTLPILSACGKKGALEIPPGEKSDYPRKYPTN
jgi:predicted small lipoprotein YifL